jgi:charged multivesicular body protein 6
MGQSASKATSHDKAILDLKVQRDKLQQYKKRTAIAADRETQAARELLAKGDRDKALLALRRKKFHESLIAKADAQLEQLLQLTANVEFARVQKEILSGIEQGTKVLQEIHKEMGGLEHVEKLMGDTAEAVAYQRELSEMLGGRLSSMDSDEVEEELARLEQEVSPSTIKQPQKPQQLPSAPSGDVVAPQRKSAEQAKSEAESRVLLPA